MPKNDTEIKRCYEILSENKKTDIVLITYPPELLHCVKLTFLLLNNVMMIYIQTHLSFLICIA